MFIVTARQLIVKEAAVLLLHRRQIHVGVVNAEMYKCFETKCLIPVNRQS